MKRFGITLNVGCGTEPYDSLNHTYVKFFDSLGIDLVLLPNVASAPEIYLTRLGIEGVIFSGGNDVASPDIDIRTTSAAPVRDSTEKTLLETALRRRMPVLGICRGMQFINAYFGGHLTYNLKKSNHTTRDHAGHPHGVRIARQLAVDYLGIRSAQVNSFHNHGVTHEQVASRLEILASCEDDGIVEGVIQPAARILAIQWHPERPDCDDIMTSRLVEGFLQNKFW